MDKNTDIRCFEAYGERIMEDFVTFMDYLDNDLEKVSCIEFIEKDENVFEIRRKD